MSYLVNYSAKIGIIFHLIKYICPLCWCLTPANGQLQFTFENVGISEWEQYPNMQWEVSSAFPLDGNFSLKHNYDNPDAGTVAISVNHEMLNLLADTCRWDFLIRHGYDPSSANNWAVYLASNASAEQMNPSSTNIEAYVLGVNFSSSDDTLKLVAQNGTTITTIITSTLNWQEHIGTDSAAHLLVQRFPNGIWQLAIDTSANQYKLLGEGQNSHIAQSSFFGLYHEYSSSRDQALWIDNIFIEGTFIRDTIPPILQEATFTNNHTLLLSFKEAIDNSKLSTTNFSVKGIGIPDSIHTPNNKEVVLLFNTTFLQEETYTLAYEVEDLVGNPTNETTTLFYYTVQFKDILITEIMADPSPSQGLPEYEYVELYNRSAYPLQLGDFQLYINESVYEIPSFELLPNHYLLLTRVNAVEEYPTEINKLGIFTGTYSITNDESIIQLKDKQMKCIDSVYFSNTFHDSDKSAGGYSLELIDREPQCSGVINWTSSTDKEGGTPGKKNSVDSTITDTSRPSVISAQVLDAVITLTFTEAVHAGNTTNDCFKINNQSISISNYTVNQANVTLFLSRPLSEGEEIHLDVSCLTDLCDNAMNDTNLLFFNHPCPTYSVVISEIMADPDPPKKLPQQDYLELYNTNNYPINIYGWELQVNNNTVMLPYAIILPNSYVLIVKDADASVYEKAEQLIVLPGLPALPNESALVSIKDELKQVIHAINYRASWYNNSLKEEGGWSLEMMDLENPCGKAENWTASFDKEGGTPGFKNSSEMHLPDLVLPTLKNVQYQNDSTITICFTESMDTTSLSLSFEEENLKISSVTASSSLQECFRITFSEPIDSQVVYSILMGDTTCDCVGNPIQNGTSVSIAKPSYPDSASVLINELYFNPFPDEDDYVELLNNSNKYFLMNDFYFSNGTDKSYSISDLPLYFPPRKLIAVTPDTLALRQYHPEFGKLMQVADLPSMPDDEGGLRLTTMESETIDAVNYSSDWHSAWLDEEEGVALERLNPHWETQSATNWYSASSLRNYATPGLPNSQYTEEKNTNTAFTIENELFLPYDDNEYSLLKIHYTHSEQQLISATVFNINGQRMKTITPAAIAGSSGILTWDGSNQQGYKCPIGIYIIYIEAINPSGKIKAYKLTCTLGKKF